MAPTVARNRDIAAHNALGPLHSQPRFMLVTSFLGRRNRIRHALRNELPPRRRDMNPPSDQPEGTPLVGICMGSQSDWATMTHAAETLTGLGVAHEVRIVSAHRTPDRLRDYAVTARARGLHVIIAGAGGAAHLPGMLAAHTALPILGVPVQSAALSGMDSLLSIVQMPAGIPVGTLAIGRAGAVNAALLAAAILGLHDAPLAARLDAYRAQQTAEVAQSPGPKLPSPAT